MPILNKDDKKEVERYNKYVREAYGTNFMQDISWGNIKKGWKREYVYTLKNGKINSAMSCLVKKLPKLNYSIIYVPRGPVCDIYDIQKIENLLEEAKPLVKKYKAIMIKFDPEIKKDSKLYKMYTKSGFKIVSKQSKLIQAKYNMVINLEDKTLDELLKSFASKTRYNINYGIRKGVKTRYSNSEEDLKVFYKLYLEMCERKHIGAREYNYFKTLLNSFEKENMRIYLSSFEGEDLTATIAINYAGTTHYLYGASGNKKRNLKASYSLQLEMIKWAIETKCKKYNLGGLLNPVDENGLFRFKVGFSGEEGVVEYIGEINKVYNKFMYFLYNFILPKFRYIVRKLKGFKTE